MIFIVSYPAVNILPLWEEIKELKMAVYPASHSTIGFSGKL